MRGKVIESGSFFARPTTVRKRRHRGGLDLERLEDRVNPSSVFWDGGGDGVHWFDAENWDSDTLPVLADDVYLSNVNPVVLAGSASVNSVVAMGGLTIDGSLAVAAYSIAYGPLG